MKKLLCLLLALVLTLSMAACSDNDGEDAPEEKSWRELMEEGQALLDEEEYDDAIDVLSDAIELRDTRSDLYVLRGQAYLGKGSKSALRKAVKDFEAALDIDKKYEEAWVGLVRALMAQEEYYEAGERAEKGLEILGKSRELEKLLKDIDEELDARVPPLPEETEPPLTVPPEPEHVHNWLDANYQEPRRCVECGQTEGNPLTPDFELYNITCDLKVGGVSDYTTLCYEDSSRLTTGSLTVLSYTILDSDESHTHRDGYEWRIAEIQARFFDENALYYGYDPSSCVEDYYSIKLHDDSALRQEEGTHYSALYYGDLVDVFIRTEVLQNEWGEDSVATVVWQVSALVPIGYDGIVWGLHKSAEDYDAGYIFNSYDPANWRFFRFA